MKSLIQLTGKWFGLSILLATIVIGFADCNSAKQVAYFQDVADSVDVVKRVRNASYEEPIIHVGDILNIEVTTIDAKIGGVSSNEQTKGSSESNSVIPGYLVDKNGNIEVPIIGKLHVEGMTTMQIREMVRNNALKYYKDPLVNVRIANFYVTVIGEVKNPGRHIVNADKINIIDALALAGDLTLGGKRDNVIIIREENGESVFTRVNLNSTDIVQSKYFYLQPGDKIYVEPLKSYAKAGTSDRNVDRVITLTLGFVTMLVSITTLYIRLQ